jgi:Fur family transcriptional regulator, ferric uptake regulator
MSEPFNQLQQALKSSHMSSTKPRQVVFEALLDHEPQTMHQVVAGCKSLVDRASVYRTIALFERLGIVQRLQIGWKYKLELTDSYMHHHHHLSCVSCGQTIPLPEDVKLEHRLTSLARQQGFSPQDHQLEIRGLCKQCKTKLPVATKFRQAEVV